jgi:hypothetical protein
VVSYNGRRFRRSDATEPVVTYRQERDLLWAEIPASGSVRRGSLVGTCALDGTLDFAYCMVLDDGEVVSGRCHSSPMRLRGGGGIRLREEWERFGPNAASGVSFLEEVSGKDAGDDSVTS